MPVGDFVSDPSAPAARTFRYECPVCGVYDIVCVSHRDVKPMGIEEAAIDYWNRTLDAAERHRRDPGRTEDPPRPALSSDASACA
jgi:hypothetical protein